MHQVTRSILTVFLLMLLLSGCKWLEPQELTSDLGEEAIIELPKPTEVQAQSDIPIAQATLGSPAQSVSSQSMTSSQSSSTPLLQLVSVVAGVPQSLEQLQLSIDGAGCGGPPPGTRHEGGHDFSRESRFVERVLAFNEHAAV